MLKAYLRLHIFLIVYWGSLKRARRFSVRGMIYALVVCIHCAIGISKGLLRDLRAEAAQHQGQHSRGPQ